MELEVKIIQFRSGKRSGRYLCIYECKDCGEQVEAFQENVVAGKSKRCSKCKVSFVGESNSTHKLSKHPLYAKWNDIKRRCYNKNRKDYERYGGKGVTMCNEWLNSFESFYDWSLSNGYKDGLCLDKDILCDELGIYPKVYSPKTCKWITLSENTAYRNRKK